MGIRTIMITGDNPLTAAASPPRPEVDDFMAQATPEDKLRRIREEQTAGHLVAMTGMAPTMPRPWPSRRRRRL
jgi:K+-transporting ATPase ATPase B chain